jgi:transcriptional regulator with XRE-family HTH domain
MSAESAQAPGQVLARRVKEAREQRGWSQAELAKQVEALGYPLQRPVINRIEQGRTRAANASIEDLFALAAALGVAPVYLLVPLDDETALEVVPGVPVAPRLARAWIRGELPLPISPRIDLRELPEPELIALVEAELGRDLDAIERALMRDELQEQARDFVSKFKDLDRELREVSKRVEDLETRQKEAH